MVSVLVLKYFGRPPLAHAIESNYITFETFRFGTFRIEIQRYGQF